MNRLAGLTLAIAITTAGPAAAGVFVAAANSGTTDLGLFAAGDWLITGSGLADFTTNVGQLQFNPDGTLAQPAGAPYQDYPAGGSTTGDGGYGAGGTLIFLGALMGSFAPQGPFGNFPPAVPPPDGTYFTIGYSKVVTLAAAGHIYAQINDTFYSNNLGGYTVEVTRVVANGVPEPATWAMMLLGFFSLGSALRLRMQIAKAAA